MVAGSVVLIAIIVAWRLPAVPHPLCCPQPASAAREVHIAPGEAHALRFYNTVQTLSSLLA